MTNLQILEKHFMQQMSNKDFAAFQQSHPTLMKVILAAMDEVENKKSQPHGRNTDYVIDDRLDPIQAYIELMKQATHRVEDYMNIPKNSDEIESNNAVCVSRSGSEIVNKQHETCLKKNCNDPVHEFGYCFRHYIVDETF